MELKDKMCKIDRSVEAIPSEIKFSTEEQRKDKSRKVNVFNLSEGADRQAVINHFRACSPPNKTEYTKGPVGWNSKSAYNEGFTEKSTQTALNLDGSVFYERTISIKPSTKSKDVMVQTCNTLRKK